MKLGTVVGSVTATAHHCAYDAKKMMVVRLDEVAVGAPDSIIALDRLSAGPGDRVMVMQEGNGAGQIFDGRGPINAVIVGIVDDVHESGAK
jgi:ethanolamine utilization protein EutN